jgi:lysozyme
VAICASFLVGAEGYEPVAKHEAVDPPNVITWCFGRTNYDDPTVKAGTHFTREQCKQFLEQDLPKYAAPVQACIPSFGAMPPHRQAALVSFAYNLGPRTLCKSSVARNLNAGDVRRGCDAMLAYNRANGRVLRGLQNRRAAERAMCLRED